jgi:hypothetical protein
MQVKEEDAVLYPVERVRRPIPEDKAIRKAVEMINVGFAFPQS